MCSIFQVYLQVFFLNIVGENIFFSVTKFNYFFMLLFMTAFFYPTAEQRPPHIRLIFMPIPINFLERSP